MKKKPGARSHGGFTLIELLIVVAIIGIVAAIGIPAYRSYIDTANMSKVNSAYNYAIRLVQQEFAKDMTKRAIGIVSTLPTTDDQWIDLMDRTGTATAPGGGPIYLSGASGGKGKGFDKSGGKGKGGAPGSSADADELGAVTVVYDSGSKSIEVRRPAYKTLTAYRALIDQSSINITEE